jgi:hypothetical protein
MKDKLQSQRKRKIVRVVAAQMVRRRTDYCFWEPDILETSVLTKYPW